MRPLLLLLALSAVLSVERVSAGTIGSGTHACPASGNVAISAVTTKASWLAVQAPVGNAGTVYVGGKTVAVNSGAAIQANGSVTITGPAVSNIDLTSVFIACSNSADSVTFLYLQ